MYCTKCGEETSVQDKFCKACGNNLKGESRIGTLFLNGILKKSNIIFIIIYAIFLTIAIQMFIAVNEITKLFSVLEYYGVQNPSSKDFFADLGIGYIILLIQFILLGVLIKFFRKNPIFIISFVSSVLIFMHSMFAHSSMLGSKREINKMVEEGISYPIPFIFTAFISLYFYLALISVYIIFRTSPKFGPYVKNMERKVFHFITNAISNIKKNKATN